MGNCFDVYHITGTVATVRRDELENDDGRLKHSICRRIRDGWIFIVLDRGESLGPWGLKGGRVEATVRGANGNDRIVICTHPGLWS